MKTGTFVFAALIFCLSARSQTSFGPNISGLYNQAATSFGRAVPSLPGFTPKNQTVGSQFLFDDWVTGSVTDNAGNVFSEGYLFNYNKVNQNLYFRIKDTSVAFIVGKGEIKSVTLNDGLTTYVLEKVPAIDSFNLYQVLVKGEKYQLYRLIKTEFIAANYFTNGITSSGNMYDEFKDEMRYFVVQADGKVSEAPLRIKALKQIFEADREKVKEYFRTHSTAGSFGEEILIGLVESLNL